LQHLGNVCSFIPIYSVGESLCSLRYVADKTKTLIDHVFTNCPNNTVESKVPHLSLNHHFPVAITRKFTSNFKNEGHQYIPYRCLKSFDESLVLQELIAQPWVLVYMCEDTNDCCQIFFELFFNTLQKHAPLKQKRMKHVIQPNWIHSDILNAIKQRKYFHKKKDSGNFNLWRQTVRKLIYKAKTHYFNAHIKNISEILNNYETVSENSLVHLLVQIYLS